MAHADQNMSDNCLLPIPKTNVGIIKHNEKLIGEKAGCFGLGCSGNGEICACTFQGIKDNLIIYDYEGNVLWSSGYLLNSFAFTSAPIVDMYNRVIACDNKKIILIDVFDYDEDNIIFEWLTKLDHKGLVFSPVITNSGVIILATKNGPVYAIDSNNGELICCKYLNIDENSPFISKIFSKLNIGFYETINTPSVCGNRIYIVAHLNIGGLFSFFKRYGRLYAIDIFPNKEIIEDRLKIAWIYEFGGPSGASPLIINNTIYFDGERLSSKIKKEPHIYSINDIGQTYEINWIKKMPSPVYGSFAKDPRGGFWAIDTYTANLTRYSIDNGHILDSINIDEIVNENGLHRPCSVITVCENKTRPIIIIAASGINLTYYSSYILAIDLINNNSLLWKVLLSEGKPANLDFAFEQFPVLIKDNNSHIFFASSRGGVWVIGEKS
jgi:outer membrane protein assembly factor BamB